jgi:pyruvate dehydrogenase E2 component (dihydrolipoamide acetyltransferase)
MQAATAALMARSKKEIPHFYLQSTIDLKASMEWLAAHNTGRSSTDRVLPAALLLRATVRAALAVPELNGFYVDGSFAAAEHVDLGIAVALRSGGLVVANLREAEGLGVDELMVALKDVATRARAGRLTSSQMSVPSITVTNLGDQGAELVHGVIYPPQVALVGFGRVVDRPWAVDGMLAVRPLVVATLAADHRVSDGHRGSRFLAALDAALQKPEEL